VDEWTGELKVHLKCAPLKGKANQELLENFSSILGTEVELLRGHKSPRKVLLAKEITLEQAKQRLFPE
jgi:uncharacterized protein (TIGR00251 family)